MVSLCPLFKVSSGTGQRCMHGLTLGSLLPSYNHAVTSVTLLVPARTSLSRTALGPIYPSMQLSLEALSSEVLVAERSHIYLVSRPNLINFI
jgi:hypothetical protein